MDIDAIGKEMPRFRRIADAMERILENPFVAGTEAERKDAFEDLKVLRDFRDRIPAIEERMEAIDQIIRDVAEIKNRPIFDPAEIQQGLTEDQVKQIVEGEVRTTTERLDAMSANLDQFLTSQKAGGSTVVSNVASAPAVPDADVLTGIKGELEGSLNELLASRDEKIAALTESVAIRDDKINLLSDHVSSLIDAVTANDGKLEALMAALDVSGPDLGADQAPKTPADASALTPATEAPVPETDAQGGQAGDQRGVQDPS